jgi:predicted nucleotidyltransferase component of viral defense system
MISDAEIEQKAAELDVSPQNVERDYVHGWLLKHIYEHPALASQLVLKGGNGIRKGYLGGARYSKDLDFSSASAIDQRTFYENLQNVLIAASASSNVHFSLDRTRIDPRRLTIPGVQATEARIYFKGFYAEENITLRTHLDIGELEQTYLPVQSRSLIHPYSDAAQCGAHIRCHKLEEILASKLTTLLFRRKAQDLFDLIFSIFFNPAFNVSRAEVIRTFLKKSIFDPQARQAREQLLALPLHLFQPMWAALATPSASRFTFDSVVTRFSELIDDLFGLLTPEPTPGPRREGTIARSFSFGGAFNSTQRNTIIEAGRANYAIEATYHGVRRVIEPYKLEFKIRKKDNRGFEYFYGWDQTGGRTTPPGIKTFFSDELRDITLTTFKFSPRYPVEF